MRKPGDGLQFFRKQFINLQSAQKQSLLSGDMTGSLVHSERSSNIFTTHETKLKRRRKVNKSQTQPNTKLERRRKGTSTKQNRRLKQSRSVPSAPTISNSIRLPPLSNKIDVKEAGLIGYSAIDFQTWLKNKKKSEKEQTDASEAIAAKNEVRTKIEVRRTVALSPLLIRLKKKEQLVRKQQVLRQERQKAELQQRAIQQAEDDMERNNHQMHGRKQQHTHGHSQHEQWTIEELLQKYRIQQLDFDARRTTGGLHWSYDQQHQFIKSVLNGRYLPELHLATALAHHISTDEEELNLTNHRPQRRLYKSLHIPLLDSESLHRFSHLASGEDGDDSVLDVSKGVNRIATLAAFVLNKIPCGHQYYSEAPDIPPDVIGPVQPGTKFSVLSSKMRQRFLSRIMPVTVYHRSLEAQQAQAAEDRKEATSRGDMVALKLLEKEERMGHIVKSRSSTKSTSQALQDKNQHHRMSPDVLFVKAHQIGGRRVLVKVQAKVEKQVSFAHGKLVLHVEQAKELASEGDDKSDPYCVIFWNNVRLAHTPVVHDDLNPVWQWCLTIPLPENVEGCSLRVEVMDKDYTGTDEVSYNVAIHYYINKSMPN